MNIFLKVSEKILSFNREEDNLVITSAERVNGY